MSPDQTTVQPTSPRLRLLWLAVTHVIIGVAGALATRVTQESGAA